MKTGVILYITGDEPEHFSDEGRKLTPPTEVFADRVEVISAKSGHFDIHGAWWKLFSKGMQQVVCMMAEFTPSGDIRLTGKEMRLCG